MFKIDGSLGGNIGCGCNKKKNQQVNKSPSRPLAQTPVARVNPQPAAPPQPVVQNMAMVNLPPPPKMDAAAMRRLKQLNKDAVRKMFGGGG